MTNCPERDYYNDLPGKVPPDISQSKHPTAGQSKQPLVNPALISPIENRGNNFNQPNTLLPDVPPIIPPLPASPELNNLNIPTKSKPITYTIYAAYH